MTNHLLAEFWNCMEKDWGDALLFKFPYIQMTYTMYNSYILKTESYP